MGATANLTCVIENLGARTVSIVIENTNFRHHALINATLLYDALLNHGLVTMLPWTRPLFVIITSRSWKSHYYLDCLIAVQLMRRLLYNKHH